MIKKKKNLREQFPQCSVLWWLISVIALGEQSLPLPQGDFAGSFRNIALITHQHPKDIQALNPNV